jgi:Domain of unknown function (DUF4372)
MRTLRCSDLFRMTAFAQLTRRESLHDIGVCLTASQAELSHMGLNSVPAGSMHEVNVVDFLALEANAFCVMHRGYGPEPPRLDFARLYKLHQAGAFFVIRGKRDMNARRV